MPSDPQDPKSPDRWAPALVEVIDSWRLTRSRVYDNASLVAHAPMGWSAFIDDRGYLVFDGLCGGSPDLPHAILARLVRDALTRGVLSIIVGPGAKPFISVRGPSSGEC